MLYYIASNAEMSSGQQSTVANSGVWLSELCARTVYMESMYVYQHNTHLPVYVRIL